MMLSSSECKRIAARLKVKGWTQRELARQAQVSQPWLSQILSGATGASDSVLRRIYEPLGLKFSEKGTD